MQGSISHDNRFQWQLDTLEKFRVNGRIYAIIPSSVWDTKQERDKFRSIFRKLVDSNGGIAPMSPEIAMKVGWGLIHHEKMVYGRTYPIFSKGSGAQPTLEQTFKVQDEQIKYQPWSERARYYVNRGLKTENLMKGLIIGWADENGFSYSKKAQTEVAPGRQLEIVCGRNKRIGVDITNSKSIISVENKWKKKEYHKYVDELWVIVVADPDVAEFDEHQIDRWNEETSPNVLVIPYWNLENFLNGLPACNIPFHIPPKKRRSLEALAKCTIYNRERIKELYAQGKRLDPQTKIRDFS